MRRRGRGAIALAALMLAGLAASSCTTAPPPPSPFSEPEAVRVALLPSWSKLVAPVKVNGEGPFAFILDTGATISSVFEGSRAADGLSSTGQVAVHGVTGSASRPLTRLEIVEIGGDRHEAVQAVILPRGSGRGARLASPNRRADGIIGADILRRYAFGFDAEAGGIVLIPPGALRREAYEAWNEARLADRIPGGESYGLAVARTRIRDRGVPVIVDTGADQSLANWAVIEGWRPAARRRPGTRTEMEGAVGTETTRMLALLPRLSLGSHRWKEPVLLVLSLGSLDILGGAGGPLVVLGTDLLRQQSFLIDYAGERLYLAPEEAAPPDRAAPSPRAGLAS